MRRLRLIHRVARRRHIGGRDRRGRLNGRRARFGAHARHVELIGLAERQRGDFAARALVKNKALAGGGHAEHQSPGLRAHNDISRTINDHGAGVRLVQLEEQLALVGRGHAVDSALIARGDKQRSRGIKSDGPDVLLLGIVIGLKAARAVHPVDLAIGAGCREQLIFGVQSQRVNRRAGDFHQRLGFPFGVGLINAGAIRARPAGRRVDVALGILRQGPEIGLRGIMQLHHFRSQPHAAVAAERELLHIAFFKVAGMILHPGLGFNGNQQRGGGGREGDGTRQFHSVGGKNLADKNLH